MAQVLIQEDIQKSLLAAEGNTSTMLQKKRAAEFGLTSVVKHYFLVKTTS